MILPSPVADRGIRVVIFAAGYRNGHTQQDCAVAQRGIHVELLRRGSMKPFHGAPAAVALRRLDLVKFYYLIAVLRRRRGRQGVLAQESQLSSCGSILAGSLWLGRNV